MCLSHCCVLLHLRRLPRREASPADPKIAAFFQEHCLRCHGPDEAKGELRLDQLEADFSNPTNFDRWREVLARVEASEMPPKDESRRQSRRKFWNSSGV